MAQVAQVPAQSYAAALGQTIFPFNFYCDDSSRIRVYVNTVLIGGFTLDLNGDQIAAPGGQVELFDDTAVGDVVLVKRVSPIEQDLVLGQYGLFSSKSIEAGLDEMVRLIQELAVGVADLASGPLLPVMGQRLNTTNGGGAWVDPFGRIPKGANALFLNGQRIFLGDDYAYNAVTGVWTLNAAVDPAENKLNADFNV